MSTHPDPTRGGEALERAARDERGAIMVMGIFMCACLVGAMWYVAGIGDALVLRERVQEASDAAAISGAALHARGMNLIVLINLVMACILGIRVVLKMVQLTLVVIGAIFTALSFLFPGLGSIATGCFKAAGEMQSLISSLKGPIDRALEALSKAEVGMARVVPAAACAGGTQVGFKYGPLVTGAFSGVSADTITSGLPLQEGTPDRLCYEAGRSVASLISWAVPIPGLSSGKAGEVFGDVMGSISRGGAAYFCELGSGGSAPNLDSIFDGTANEHCDGRRQEKVDKLNADNGAWLKKCDEYKVSCFERDEFGNEYSFMTDTEHLKPQQRQDLSQLQQARDESKDDLDAFNYGKCKDGQLKELREKVKSEAGTSGAPSSGKGMTPKMVLPKWQNGQKSTQIMGWADADLSLLRIGPKGVKVGSQKRATPNMDAPIGAGFAFSQAEYFYDCSGAWGGEDCNGAKPGDNEGAMWKFRWRARLRRYNRPYNNLSTVLEAPYVIPAHAAMSARAASAPLFTWTSPGNIALKGQLFKFLNPIDTLQVSLH